MAPNECTILSEKQPTSEIAEFYQGKVIFITGEQVFWENSSRNPSQAYENTKGFDAHVSELMLHDETLPRCCPDVKKIYLLCRPKKGKSIKERLFHQFKDPLYEHIRKMIPEYLLKVAPVDGDAMKHNFGIKEEDLKTLVNETNIVFHLAATVRFDEDLRLAVPVNVRSTRDILRLARRMTNLSAFVHVSTAYSNCTQKDIKEKFYKPPIDGDLLIELVERLDDEMLLRMTPGLLGEYPNTYTFTKCVAEDLVRKYSAGLPIAMIRPSIVMPKYAGPCPGWTDNLNGPVGLALGVYLGVIRTVNVKKENEVAFIPADYVVNGTIAVAWNVATRTKSLATNGVTTDEISGLGRAKYEKPSAENESKVDIYNSVNFENSITWGMTTEHILSHGLAHPSRNTIWKPFCIFVENDHLFKISSWLVHWIPAYIADTLLQLAGRKPMLMQIYTKAEKHLIAFKYFSKNEWTFNAANMKQLFEKLSATDKTTFPFDVKQINWKKHVHQNCAGVKKYILKDDLAPTHKRLLLFSIAHYALCALFLFLFLMLLKLLFN